MSKHEQTGAPPHEAPPGRDKTQQRQQGDAMHGYTQDSGFATSGGPAPAAERADTDRKAKDAASPDEQLARNVRVRLDDYARDLEDLSVQVQDGIVTLQGSVKQSQSVHAITDAVRKLPNVRDVRADLKSP